MEPVSVSPICFLLILQPLPLHALFLSLSVIAMLPSKNINTKTITERILLVCFAINYKTNEPFVATIQYHERNSMLGIKQNDYVQSVPFKSTQRNIC